VKGQYGVSEVVTWQMGLVDCHVGYKWQNSMTSDTLCTGDQRL
jgi:hypothetical protein